MAKTHVIQAQSALAAANYYDGKIDGDFGGASLRAVLGLIDSTDKAVDILTKPDVEQPTKPNTNPSGFKLSNTSLNRLKGIKPSLHRVVERAIFLSGVDFMVVEGLRTKAKQAEYVRKGASQTMNSKHLTGDAVDIVPYVNGKADWDNWNHIFTMTTAMQKAAQELGVNVRWGGAWVTVNNKAGTPYEWVEEYKAAQRKKGKSAFMDGVHFELA